MNNRKTRNQLDSHYPKFTNCVKVQQKNKTFLNKKKTKDNF